jgi:hypothetical protein
MKEKKDTAKRGSDQEAQQELHLEKNQVQTDERR